MRSRCAYRLWMRRDLQNSWHLERVRQMKVYAHWAFLRLMGLRGQMCLLVAIWWAVSAAITVVMKQTVGSDGGYQFPFALTALTNGVCGWFSMCACFCQKGNFWNNSSLRRIDVAQLIFLGILQGVEIGMSNKSLHFLSVSTRTILNSTSVLFMMISAQFWGIEQLDRLRILSAAFQILGGFLNALGASHPHTVGDTKSFSQEEIEEANDQISGTLLQLCTLLIASQRWVMLQSLMQKSSLRLGKLELSAWIMPVTSLVCFMMAAAFETPALSLSLMLDAGLPRVVLIIACGITILTVAELRLVHISSAVALQVLATLHQIPLVITGVVFFQDSVELVSGMGFTCCLLGALCYAGAKHSPTASSQEHEHGTELLPVLEDDESHGFRRLAAPSRTGSRSGSPRPHVPG
ncbi:Probable sugar phosphate/phosphate translocator At1g06470 [Durusdinium trenchii]